MGGQAIQGFHHVTAIATDPVTNLGFYTHVLGLRLVKKTVNFDDPGTYHFYFGDGVGSPGTIITFFPWPGAYRGSRGTGQIESTAFAVPPDSIGFWLDHLHRHQVLAERVDERFGEPVIRLLDPDGLQLELIGSAVTGAGEPWTQGGVSREAAIRHVRSVAAALEGYERTARLLTEMFGYRLVQQDGNRFRFAPVGEGTVDAVDLICMPDSHPGQVGAGSVHHIAFRVPNDAEQQQWRSRLVEAGLNVSPVMDRDYFHSIYFREPGGILFEIATDPPGFTADETLEQLGQKLKLPKPLEPHRAQIERLLPKLA
jgi:glyoxalase family protein